MEEIDFRIRVEYIQDNKNTTKYFCESDYKKEAIEEPAFKLLKKIVKKFAELQNNIQYYILSIIVHQYQFDILFTDLNELDNLEGFKAYGSGGGDAFPVSIGVINLDKKYRVEFLDGRFVFRNM